MKDLLPEVHPGILETELKTICDFYGTGHADMLKLCQPVQPYFETYCELVFGKDSFELITAGKGEELVKDMARAASLPESKTGFISLFEHCAGSFPGAVKGIKFCFSPGKDLAPTLYVRTKADKEEVFRSLGSYLSPGAFSGLQAALADNHILYGLGFSEKNGSLYIKTYAIAEVPDSSGKLTPGFISWRLSGNKLSREHKEYLPEKRLTEYVPGDKRMKEVRDFLLYEMQYDTAGHIGLLFEDGEQAETKIYIERKGGIPTDFSAR